ncbi:hypothetical protein [Candidatus Nitrosotenuis aquarius]|uniref:hypothetical protein n=1 Tax=Candidatus Nitrosotenuis aquarius TaxID=1846278 RepID=UPI000C1E7160|nr:hypothetical protein [Candidatus Nitrosotenuis aquarius]
MSGMEDSARLSIVEVIEGFINKINQIQRTLVGISISALILAPMAIGLSIYLITHPHFFFIMEEYDEFGLFLAISLGVIIAVSVTWLALGIRQYIMLKSWNTNYSNYIQKKEQVDNRISSEFKLDEDQEP